MKIGKEREQQGSEEVGGCKRNPKKSYEAQEVLRKRIGEKPKCQAWRKVWRGILWQGERGLLLQRQRVQFTMSLRKLREESMTINSHAKGSKESHSEV